MRLILTLLLFGCPIPAIVMAFKVHERPLADWLDKAGNTPGLFRNIWSVKDSKILGRYTPVSSGAAPSAACCGSQRR